MNAGHFRRALGCGVALLAGLAILAATPWAASAQAPYPSRLIKLVVGFAAGGGNDIFARIIAAKMQEDFGQTVIVENRPGASGMLAAEYVKHANPDGAAGRPRATIVPAISVRPYHGTKDHADLDDGVPAHPRRQGRRPG
jgi:tripartite-type tricarboxylate transporter receptor subunit TctC